MKISLGAIVVSAALSVFVPASSSATGPPHIKMENGTGQLIVNGQPFLGVTERRLNGDQTNQGRQLLLDPHRPHIYRVRLYSIPAQREP